MFLMRLIVVGCSLIVLSCVNSAAQSQPSITDFWKWFARHEKELSAGEDPAYPAAVEIGSRLKDLDEGLTFEVGLVGSQGKKQLAISADSNPQLFPLVKQIVAAAPPLEHWEVVAFRQRTPPDLLRSLAARGQASEDGKPVPGAPVIAVEAGQMKFDLTRNGHRADLVLYIKDYQKDSGMDHMAYILVQQAAGERDFVEKIENIYFKPLDEKAKHAKPLEELGPTLDALLPSPDGRDGAAEQANENANVKALLNIFGNLGEIALLSAGIPALIASLVMLFVPNRRKLASWLLAGAIVTCVVGLAFPGVVIWFADSFLDGTPPQ